MRRVLLKPLFISSVVFTALNYAGAVSADVMYTLNVWALQKDTQIRVMTTFEPSMAKCQERLDKSAAKISGRGYKLISNDSSKYEGIHTSSSLYSQNNKNFWLGQCKQY